MVKAIDYAEVADFFIARSSIEGNDRDGGDADPYRLKIRRRFGALLRRIGSGLLEVHANL